MLAAHLHDPECGWLQDPTAGCECIEWEGAESFEPHHDTALAGALCNFEYLGCMSPGIIRAREADGWLLIFSPESGYTFLTPPENVLITALQPEALHA